MKYTLRKLLIGAIILSLIFGPGIYDSIKKIVAPSVEVRIARIIENLDPNLDVLYVMFNEEDTSELVVMLLLDKEQYWTDARKYETLLTSILYKGKEFGFEKLMIFIGWEEGEVIAITECSYLRFDSCETQSGPPFLLNDNLYPWAGKGTP